MHIWVIDFNKHAKVIPQTKDNPLTNPAGTICIPTCGKKTPSPLVWENNLEVNFEFGKDSSIEQKS